MKKILFLMLASVLVLGLGCSSRAKTPNIKSKRISTSPGTGNQEIVKPGGGTKEEDTPSKDDSKDTDNPGSKDTDNPGSKDTDNPGSKDTDNPDGGNSKVTISSEIEDVESWDGKSDRAPSGYTIKDIKQ